MTPIHTYANPPTRGGPTVRVSASDRPIPLARMNDRRTPAWIAPVWATTVARAKIMATVVALFVMVVLFVAAPPAVMILIAAMLVTALFVGGSFLLLERQTRRRFAASRWPDHVTRRDA